MPTLMSIARGEEEMEQSIEYSQKPDALPDSGLHMTDVTMKDMILTLKGLYNNI